jgi:lysophospholipase L1-like esterase
MTRILALGDSYTIGEAVADNERWVEQLAVLLGEHGHPIAGTTIIARTGWTTDELSAGIDAAHPVGPFELVTLLVGVNDQYRGRTAAEHRAPCRALLTRAAGLAGNCPSCVMVLSIPDWGVTPFAEGRDRQAIGAEIDAFNAVAREESAREGAAFVDVTPSSRRAASVSDRIASDGLHPSGRMYAEWAQLALPAALKIVISTGRATRNPSPPV